MAAEFERKVLTHGPLKECPLKEALCAKFVKEGQSFTITVTVLGQVVSTAPTGCPGILSESIYAGIFLFRA